MTEERVKRKISAILSADVAGYSRLMGEDEVSTVRTLEAYRKVMSDLIEQFRGRVVDSPGDNLLSEFSSVVDAVQCAVEIHEVIRAKNEELPEDRRMLFRIGVNLGDVIEEGDRIYGDGVNIAARLEGLAEAGGICISGSAHEQIKNKLALGYEYIGEHTVKNIAEPLKVYRVPMGPKGAAPKEGNEKKTKLKNWQWTALGAVGAIIVIIGALAIWNSYLSGPSIEPPSIEAKQVPATTDVKEAPKTIAVLPFDDFSPKKDQEYFVNGLSEEILNTIAQIPDLTVIARTSSFALKGANKTIQEMGDVLGASHILEGSVRKAGDALRVTAQVVRSADGAHLWSKTYDRELKEIFAVQEEIAIAVADELKITLGIVSLKQLGGTENEKAYELFLTAKGKRDEANMSGYKSALDLVDAAIVLDPEFAIAWAYKANIHHLLNVFGPYSRAIAEADAGIRAAQKAIELEPNLADGYIYLGWIKAFKSEWIEAELNYRKSIELIGESLSFNDVFIVPFYISVGKFKRAYELLEEMRRNDPISQAFRWWYYNTYVLLGDRQRAEEEYQRRNKLLLKGYSDWHDNAITQVRLGSGDVLSKDEIVSSDPIHIIVKEYLDSPEEGLVQLRRIYSNDDNLSHMDLLLIFLWAGYFGDPELAMDAIEKDASINATGSYYWFPAMRDIRKTPRFKKFVREIGLVDYWKEFGWPDLCRPVGDDDFVCD
jgi:adenylate cyclase